MADNKEKNVALPYLVYKKTTCRHCDRWTAIRISGTTKNPGRLFYSSTIHGFSYWCNPTDFPAAADKIEGESVFTAGDQVPANMPRLAADTAEKVNVRLSELLMANVILVFEVMMLAQWYSTGR